MTHTTKKTMGKIIACLLILVFCLALFTSAFAEGDDAPAPLDDNAEIITADSEENHSENAEENQEQQNSAGEETPDMIDDESVPNDQEADEEPEPGGAEDMELEELSEEPSPDESSGTSSNTVIVTIRFPVGTAGIKGGNGFFESNSVAENLDDLPHPNGLVITDAVGEQVFF
ncbi:MAG: hypothetical protein LBD85_02115 [Oscillospiraceae bacterium]|jgi:hypothetical protein|nr:hypothetical protein [Oscillospiraceae bacterium]